MSIKTSFVTGDNVFDLMPSRAATIMRYCRIDKKNFDEFLFSARRKSVTKQGRMPIDEECWLWILKSPIDHDRRLFLMFVLFEYNLSQFELYSVELKWIRSWQLWDGWIELNKNGSPIAPRWIWYPTISNGPNSNGLRISRTISIHKKLSPIHFSAVCIYSRSHCFLIVILFSLHC